MVYYGKNIKSYATSQQSISPGKGGKPHGKKSKSLLTVHIRFFGFFYKQNFSNLRFVFWQNFQRIIQIPCNSPQKKNLTNNAKFAPFIHYHYTFRCLTSSRELSEIPANQAKFTPFAHKSHELCKICTIYSSTSSSLLSDL